MNPAAQVQVNTLTPSSQVAPLIHGLLSHSFKSTITSKTYAKPVTSKYCCTGKSDTSVHLQLFLGVNVSDASLQ